MQKINFHWEFCGFSHLRIICTFVASHGLLHQGNPEYDAKRQQLYEYYHPLEFSPNIGVEEKTKLMEEWCVTQFSDGGDIGTKLMVTFSIHNNAFC